MRASPGGALYLPAPHPRPTPPPAPRRPASRPRTAAPSSASRSSWTLPTRRWAGRADTWALARLKLSRAPSPARPHLPPQAVSKYAEHMASKSIDVLINVRRAVHAAPCCRNGAARPRSPPGGRPSTTPTPPRSPACRTRASLAATAPRIWARSRVRQGPPCCPPPLPHPRALSASAGPSPQPARHQPCHLPPPLPPPQATLTSGSASWP